jgi:hypothetical protein
MQDHPLDHSGAHAPAVVEHLDLVTAELRRRIAGIGLAIAELREETGRLRASADGRYHAVAVLDRPLDADPAVAVDELRVAPQPSVIEPMMAVFDAGVATDVRFESRVAEPVPPWSTAPVLDTDLAPVDAVESAPAPVAVAVVAERMETVDAPAAPDVAEPTLTWVPEPAPAAVVTPVVVSPVVDVAPPVGATVAVIPAVMTPVVEVAAPVEWSQDAHAALPAVPAPLWGDGDDEDSAAFEAFFSAEIEPEPSQRWLLSD